MARLLRLPPSSARLLALATLLANAWGFVPPTSIGSSKPTAAAAASSSSTKLDVARLDLYPGLKGLFEVGNIILDEVKNGGKEARQVVQQDTGELRDFFKRKVGAAPEDVVHPVFGELVKDLVYKKVYCTSVEKLIAIPIWEQQRIYRPERAQLLAQDIKAKLQDGKPLTLPGVITVYEMGEARGLLDGQHRVGALKMLAESEVLMPEAHLILVEVFPVLQQEDVKRLFIEVNNAQPVSLIDMPDMANVQEKVIITEAAEILRMEYPNMFKVSTNCRLPHVNIDLLRDALFKCNVVGRTGMASADQLVEWVKGKNALVAAKTDAEWKESYRGRNPETVAKAVDKARAHNFFLGLEPNWMDYGGEE